MLGVGQPLPTWEVPEILEQLQCPQCGVLAPQVSQPGAEHWPLATWTHQSTAQDGAQLGHMCIVPPIPEAWQGTLTRGFMGADTTPSQLRLQWVAVPIPGAPQDPAEAAAAKARAQSAKDSRRAKQFAQRVKATGAAARLPHYPSTVGGPRTWWPG